MKRFILFSMILALLTIPIQAGAGSLAKQLLTDEKVITNVAKALPATTQGPIFTVAGGPIEILSFTGEVTTEIGLDGTGGVSLKIVIDPTTPATDTDIGELLEIGGDNEDTFYTLITSISTAIASYANGVGPSMDYKIICPAGQIEANTNATVDGNITWRMRYRPLAPGVTVTAE